MEGKWPGMPREQELDPGLEKSRFELPRELGTEREKFLVAGAGKLRQEVWPRKGPNPEAGEQEQIALQGGTRG